MPKRRDDEDSVDSKGNIRDLIDYDYEETTESSTPPRRERKAKTEAKRKLRSLFHAEEASKETDDDDVVRPKRHPATEKPKSATPVKNPYLKRKKMDMDLDTEEQNVLIMPTTDKKKEKVVPKVKEKNKNKNKEKMKDKKKHKKAKQSQSSSSSSSSYSSSSSSEEDDYDYDDEEEEEDEEDEEDAGNNRRQKSTFDIIISDMMGGGAGKDPNKPKKYNMKKEPESVKRFVKLVQQEDEGAEDTIDNDITYFKSLNPDKQAFILRALETKASPAEVPVPLKFKILEKIAVKPELSRIAMAKYNALCNLEPSSSEYYKCSHWITGFTDLPLGTYKDLPVSLDDGPEKCGEFMSKVHSCLETAIYGHEEAKLQIMQFVSSWIANPKSNGNVLSIHGPPGTGKTSMIKDGVAKALGRPFHFITLGGATDASFLDGHSYTYEGSTWGKIADVLMQSKCMNPIIYFDELDKVSETPKGDEINNLLIHLTDGSQNDRFQDKYFTGIDFDLSRCLFIFSHNNNDKVNPILRDRMYTIQVEGFQMKDKLLIAENYLIVGALRDSGLFEKMTFSKDILQYIIENFTGGEAGVRELKRCIQTIISKINLLRFYNNPKQVPFAIKDFTLPFTLKKEHIELFLKKKEAMNPSIAYLYT